MLSSHVPILLTKKLCGLPQLVPRFLAITHLKVNIGGKKGKPDRLIIIFEVKMLMYSVHSKKNLIGLANTIRELFLESDVFFSRWFLISYIL